MPFKRTWKALCLSCLTLLIGTTLVACGNDDKSEQNANKKETQTAQITDKEKVKEPEVKFEERPVTIDYSKSEEEILANYTEQGMNLFKVNFPDTLSMNYALKHIGLKAPEIEGKTMSGQKIKLSSLKNKNVLIVFSKTTCSICKEMTSVEEQIAKDHKDLVVLTVFPVDNNADIKTYYKDLKLNVPKNTLSLEDNQNLKNVAIKNYNIEQIPTFIFVDKTGKISYTYIGNKDKTMFEDMIHTAYDDGEKLYDNVRIVTIRVDKDGNEIKEDKLIDADSVDHTESDEKAVKTKEESKADNVTKSEKTSDKKADEDSKEESNK